jgi:hypothetical protein
MLHPQIDAEKFIADVGNGMPEWINIAAERLLA